MSDQTELGRIVRTLDHELNQHWAWLTNMLFEAEKISRVTGQHVDVDGIRIKRGLTREMLSPGGQVNQRKLELAGFTEDRDRQFFEAIRHLCVRVLRRAHGCVGSEVLVGPVGTHERATDAASWSQTEPSQYSQFESRVVCD